MDGNLIPLYLQYKIQHNIHVVVKYSMQQVHCIHILCTHMYMYMYNVRLFVLGMKLKIHVVDLETGEVKDPIPIRAEHTWTIEELKVVIGDVSTCIK